MLQHHVKIQYTTPPMHPSAFVPEKNSTQNEAHASASSIMHAHDATELRVVALLCSKALASCRSFCKSNHNGGLKFSTCY